MMPDAFSDAWSNLQTMGDTAVRDVQTALGSGPKVGVPPAVAISSPATVHPAGILQDSFDALSRAPQAVHDWFAKDPLIAGMARDAIPQLSTLAGKVGAGLSALNQSTVEPSREAGEEIGNIWNGGLADVKRGAEDYAAGDIGPNWNPVKQVAGAGRAAFGASQALLAPVGVVAPLGNLMGRSGVVPSGVGDQTLQALRGDPVQSPALNVGPKEASDYWRSLLETAASFVPLGGFGGPRAVAGEGAEVATRFRPPPDPNGGWNLGPDGFAAHPDGSPVIFASPKEAAPFFKASAPHLPNGMRWEIANLPGSEEGVGLRAVATERPTAPSTPFEQATAQAEAEARMEEAQVHSAAVTALPFHSALPEATDDFLTNHTGAGSRMVGVDPRALVQIADEGHLPFPELVNETGNAIASGGRVMIPYSTYLARTAGQSWADILHSTTRFDPDVPSVEEANNPPVTTEGIEPTTQVGGITFAKYSRSMDRPSGWTISSGSHVISQPRAGGGGGLPISFPTAGEAAEWAASRDHLLPRELQFSIRRGEADGQFYLQAEQRPPEDTFLSGPQTVLHDAIVGARENAILALGNELATRHEGGASAGDIRDLVRELPLGVQNWMAVVRRSKLSSAASRSIAGQGHLSLSELLGHYNSPHFEEIVHNSRIDNVGRRELLDTVSTPADIEEDGKPTVPAEMFPPRDRGNHIEPSHTSYLNPAVAEAPLRTPLHIGRHVEGVRHSQITPQMVADNLIDNAGRSFYTAMRAEFGQPWVDLNREVSTFLQTFRDTMVSMAGEAELFATRSHPSLPPLSQYGIGTATDRQYHGIHVPPSAAQPTIASIFINPLLFGDQVKTPEDVFGAIVGTMAHELAHYSYQEHGDPHAALTAILSRLGTSDVMDAAGARLLTFLTENFDVFKQIRSRYEGPDFFPRHHVEGDLWRDRGQQVGTGQAPTVGHRLSSATEGGAGEPSGGRNVGAEIADAQSDARRYLADHGLLHDTGPASHELIEKWLERLDGRIKDAIEGRVIREATPEFKQYVEERAAAHAEALERDPGVAAWRELERKGGPRILNTDVPGNLEGFPKSFYGKGKSALEPEDLAEELGFGSASEMALSLMETRERSGGKVGEWVQERAHQLGKLNAQEKFGTGVMGQTLTNLFMRSAIGGHELTKILEENVKELARWDYQGDPTTLGEEFHRIDLNGLRLSSRQGWERMLAKDARDSEVFEGTVGQSGKKVTEALRARELATSTDDLDVHEENSHALAAKRSQLFSQLQLRRANELGRLIRGAERVLEGAKEGSLKDWEEIDPNARKILKLLTYYTRIDRGRGPTPQARKASVTKSIAANIQSLPGRSISGWRNEMMQRGLEPFVITPSSILDFNKRSALVAKQLAQMTNAVEGIGRRLDTVEMAGEEEPVPMGAVATNVSMTARRVGRYHGPAAREKWGKLRKRTAAVTHSAGSVFVRPEVQLWWADGEKPGPLIKGMMQPLDKGEKWITARRGQFYGMDREVVKANGKGWVKSLEEDVDVPSSAYHTEAGPVRAVKTRAQAISAMLHFGTEDGKLAFRAAYGVDGDKVEAELGRVLGEGDWRFIENKWKQMGMVSHAYRELEKRVRGTNLTFEAGRHLLAGEGENWEHDVEGGYWPANYTWEGGTPEGGPLLGDGNYFGRNYRSALKEANARTLLRNDVRPLDLSFDSLNRQIYSILADLAYRPAVIQARGMLQNSSIRRSLGDVLGPEYLKTMDNWLQWVSRLGVYDAAQGQALANFIRLARRNFIRSQVGFNLVTVFRHSVIATAHVVGSGGVPRVSRAAYDLWLADRPYWRDFVRSNSTEVRTAIERVDQDLGEIIDRVREKGGRATLDQFNALLFAVPKQYESEITWLAVYREAMGDMEGDSAHADAVYTADKAVRDTQGTGASVHRPELLRYNNDVSGALQSLFTSFQTFENTSANRFWTSGRKMEQASQLNAEVRRLRLQAVGASKEERGRIEGEIRDKMDRADRQVKAAIWALSTFGALTTALLYGANEAINPEQDPWTGIPQLLAGTFLGGTMPLSSSAVDTAREMGGIAEKAVTGKEKGGRGEATLLDPETQSLTTMGGAVAETAATMMTGTITDPQIVRKDLEAAGIRFGAYTKPFARAGQYVFDRNVRKVVPNPTMATDIRGVLTGQHPREGGRGRPHTTRRGGRSRGTHIHLWGGPPPTQGEGW